MTGAAGIACSRVAPHPVTGRPKAGWQHGVTALLAFLVTPTDVFADGSEPESAPQRVQAIGTTLLPGFEVDLRKLPANAQVFGSGMLHR